MKKKKTHAKRGVRRNLRPVFLLLLIPMAIGLAVAAAVVTGLYRHNLADFGNKRLATQNWEGAQKAMIEAQPKYERKFAYYKVKENQTWPVLAAHFSVDEKKLRAMNPGILATGTTIKVPVLEKPYAPLETNGRINQAIVTEDRGILRVTQKHRLGQNIITDIPELAAYLKPYDAFTKTGPTTWRLNRPVSLDGDIRLDVTPATVSKLELVSSPDNITCLCFDQSAVLFDSVEVTSIDPKTGRQDSNYADGRAFVRMKNGRMDILRSKFTYLGNALEEVAESNKTGLNPYLQEGGVYGVSWRISSDTLGANLTTGWVERTTFERNHFGTYSFGASGMMWKSNRFAYNDIYGLDPHDDSNNMMVEGNVFENNGKHGFIVSKRCNYNVIRNNISMGNKLHGYMLHQDSAYNVMENNVAYGNEDNYVIYESNYNTVRNNKSYLARSAHIRVNKASNNTYITGNEMIGGIRGIYLYAGVRNTLISNNSIQRVNKSLQTVGAANTLFADNKIDGLKYDISKADSNTVIFGLNTIDAQKGPIPNAATVYQNYLRTRPSSL